MTPLCDPREEALVALLRRQPGVSFSAQELGQALGLGSRLIRATLSHLRRDHAAPIASNSAEGFSWPRSRAEIDRTVAQILSRVEEMKQVAEGVRAGGEWLFGDERTGQLGLGL